VRVSFEVGGGGMVDSATAMRMRPPGREWHERHNRRAGSPASPADGRVLETDSPKKLSHSPP